MPIIRNEVNHFVTSWNGHMIRRQPNRPNAVQGIPQELYQDPPNGVVDYGNTPNLPSLDTYDRIAAEYGTSVSSFPTNFPGYFGRASGLIFDFWFFIRLFLPAS
jgi:hypothetical protein